MKTVVIGRVSPAEGADLVWLIGEKDSIKTGLISGQFYFEIKPGTYRLMVDAKPPYKGVWLDNIVVRSEETHDVGEIILKP